MQFKHFPSPHAHQENTHVSTVMRQVLYALIPGVITYVWFFGWGVVIHLFIASITSLTCEALILKIRQRPLSIFLTDNSALVTAWLLALALPPIAPWWVTVLGVSFAIVFAKHLYGGLGYNPFNPAMVGYVMLLISFPMEMTHWPALPELGGHYLGLADSFNLILFEHLKDTLSLDAISGATALDTMKNQLIQLYTVSEISQKSLFGHFGAKGWEWLSVSFLVGGCWLLYRKVITWHVPVAMLGSLFLISLIFFLIDSDIHPSPGFHLFSGAAMFGAFFIATDPVTAATSNKGKLWFGAGIGILVYIIRSWGGYPDGVAFAVLLMNMAAPTIDYYTRPRVFGH